MGGHEHTPAPATAAVGRTSAPPAEPRRAYRGTEDRWLGGVAVGTGPAPGAPGAVGPDGFPGPGRLRRLRRGAVRRPVAVPARPAAHPDPVPGPGRRHPPGQAPRPAAAPARRLRTAGRGGRHRARRPARCHHGHRPDAGASVRSCSAAAVSPCSGGRPTRPSATGGATRPAGSARSARSSVAVAGAPTCVSVPGLMLLIAAITLFSLRSRQPHGRRSTWAWRQRSASSGSGSWWVRGCSGCPPTSARSARPGCARRSGPTSPRTCTTRCCRPWP